VVGKKVNRWVVWRESSRAGLMETKKARIWDEMKAEGKVSGTEHGLADYLV
jgi:hypothetical protein